MNSDDDVSQKITSTYGMSETTLREAYNALDFQLLESTPHLDVPVCTPARFDYDPSPRVHDADKIADYFERSSFSLWDSFPKNGERWYEFSVSGRVHHRINNERANVDISTGGVTITTKDDEFSFRTFRTLVSTIEDAVECNLVPEEVSPDE